MSYPPDPIELRGAPYRRTNPGQEPAHYICTTPRPREPEPVSINDNVKRVLWTAGQAAAGALLDVLTNGQVTWRAALYTVAVAALKAIVAHRATHPPPAT